MGYMELIFTMSVKRQQQNSAKQNAQGFSENKDAAKNGGTIAGDARRTLR